MRIFALIALLAATACSPADNTTSANNAGATTEPQTPTTSSVNSMTLADYVQAAAMSDMYEVQAGQLASTRAQNTRVRAFAREMVTDHTATTRGLQAALQGVPNAPTPPSQLDQRHMDMLQQLRDATAQNFDERYVDQQTQAHRDALNTHQRYAQNGDTETVRAFAAETAPKVQHHLDMISQLDSSGADEPNQGTRQ